MAQKIALVVGGSNGIGQAIATHLISKGVFTVIASRNPDKTAAIAAKIGASDHLIVDVSSQADVSRFAAQVRAKLSHIDFLVFTAGAVFDAKRLTADGVDELVAVNHLWRFQLTTLLRDVYFDDPNFLKPGAKWTMVKALWQAQQLNDVFMLEAQRRWGSLGNGIQFHVVNPGIVSTNGDLSGLSPFGRFMFGTVLNPVKQSMEASASRLCPILLDSMGDVGGKLWNASYWTGAVSEIKPAPRVVDTEYVAKCWALSENLLVKKN
ncbi:NAD(P)-binding protein [Rhizoclosmatium globosum]|uniref:NAD(P)-binding protein n=1 Tax=Rhizoclosmatium globosum TaxID=329046 RepID=A0A1Y2C9W3_9FUNG|nr:NAD(P)-binding protein [Rhizoclosmatium globosum]|eukprot:ORY43644.1 NAD(P)-binding protein [Rhizoclosmatium globosum]